MTIWVAMLLGLVQGLCEFLPVSSSGHLLLLSRIFGVTEGAMFFTVMLHIATLAAVLIVYWDLVWKLAKRPVNRTVGLLLLALVPTVLLAILFKKVEPFATFYENAEGGQYLGVCFLITTVLLVVSDRIRIPAKKQRKLKEMRVKDALIIGGMQGVGVMPGVSRSGSTISGALFSSLTRKAAADFSFLLSIPSIVGGAVLEIPDAITEGIGDTHWTSIVAGMLVAAVTGYFAIRFMLRVIKRKKLWGFAVYTGVLCVFVLLDQLILHLWF